MTPCMKLVLPPLREQVEHVTPGGKRKVRVASLLLKYAGAACPQQEVGHLLTLAARVVPGRGAGSLDRDTHELPIFQDILSSF